MEKQKHYINANNVDKVEVELDSLTAKSDDSGMIDNGDSHNPLLSMTKMLYSMNKTSDNEVDVDDGGNMEDLEMADMNGNEENLEEPKTEDGELKILKTDILQNEPEQAESTEESGEDFTASPIIIEEEEINDDADKEIATDAIQELVVWGNQKPNMMSCLSVARLIVVDAKIFIKVVLTINEVLKTFKFYNDDA